jgi:hypothetical protein
LANKTDIRLQTAEGQPLEMQLLANYALMPTMSFNLKLADH